MAAPQVILACPFCGGAAFVWGSWLYAGGSPFFGHVNCETRDCGHGPGGGGGTIQAAANAAIAAWNKRDRRVTDTSNERVAFDAWLKEYDERDWRQCDGTEGLPKPSGWSKIHRHSAWEAWQGARAADETERLRVARVVINGVDVSYTSEDHAETVHHLLMPADEPS